MSSAEIALLILQTIRLLADLLVRFNEGQLTAEELMARWDVQKGELELLRERLRASA